VPQCSYTAVCDHRKQTEERCDSKLAEMSSMREELQRQINELREDLRLHASDPLRHSIGQTTSSSVVRQKPEVRGNRAN